MFNRGVVWLGSLALPAVLLMSGSVAPADGLQIPLNVRNFSEARCPSMPFWTGLPLPRGAVADPAVLRLKDANGNAVSAQFDVLARWADKSVKWVLVSFFAAPAAGGTQGFTLSADGAAEAPKPAKPLQVVLDPNCCDIVTGPIFFRLNRHGFTGLEQVWLDVNGDGQYESDEMMVPQNDDAGIVAVDKNGTAYTSRLGTSGIQIESKGPLHAVVAVRGDLRAENVKEPLLDYVARYHAFAGSSLVRVVVTMHNPRPAGRSEDGGRWGLGQGGSVYLKSLDLLQPLRLPEGHRRVSLSTEPGKLLDRVPLVPMCVYQDSSGGENWFNQSHLNRNNEIPLAFRGYRLSYKDRVLESGLRATPWLDVCDMRWGLSVGMPLFWQNFPKALGVEADGAVRVSLWPKQSLDVHEIQGGEQKTHEYWMYFRHRRPADRPAGDAPASRPFGRFGSLMPFDREVMPQLLDRPVAWASADAYAAADALDPLVAVQTGKFDAYETIMAAAVRGKINLYTHRETQDEYGWRDFGDTPAYNERDQTQSPTSGLACLSHYNNEYDLGLGMLQQALRTADADPKLAKGWYELAMQALWHEADIDIYHTKDAPSPIYQGGTFTHTAHGVDAGKSNHRASPKDEMYGRLNWAWGRGGGTESGHLRNRGIQAAYLVSGDRHLLEASNELAELVAYKIGNDKFAQIDVPDRAGGNNLQILLDTFMVEAGASADVDKKRIELCQKLIASLTPEAVRKRSGEKGFADIGWSTALYVKQLYRYVQEMSQRGVQCELAISSHVEYAKMIRQPFDRRGRSSGPWSLLTCEVMMQAAELTKDAAEKAAFLKAAQAAFHACDSYVGPDGRGGYFNSKTLTMLLQGGGLYMRQALAKGDDWAPPPPASQPSTRGAGRRGGRGGSDSGPPDVSGD